ncbi:MerR family transcriptional regulator [Desulfobotulus mexicanus]|uniref:Methyltransferase domain-containing protein n=1 Tax=Desulfobotulus mexicanus TaxID=2586642 RepID=A0A5S5MFC1_9BACT|nr:MerR family transcriptional regulator [Desulfobotulus mexicanus]TYT74379.1 methyltransferase domain-containing protein [Desulfobotulus mexicanus]
MYHVSDITRRLGIARSTLLYYQRIGLVSPARDDQNGYRIYSESDLERLVTIRCLQRAGFSLTQCQDCLEGKMDAAMLREQLLVIEREILHLKTAESMLRALCQRTEGKAPPQAPGADPLRHWHAAFEKQSPQAHLKWLQALGFSEKTATQIRCVSRNMENHEVYMEDFFKVFETMKRQGPGSWQTTMDAFRKIENRSAIRNILEIGCGKGETALTLAEVSEARITTVDNHEPFLDALKTKLTEKNLSHRIQPLAASMLNLPFEDRSFDLIWCEGAAYIMGFEKALATWKKFLIPDGHLFISDPVWLTNTPSAPCKELWDVEYPDMCSIEDRCRQAEKAGYLVVDASLLPRQDWQDFYDDMERTLLGLKNSIGERPAFQDMKEEISMNRQYGDEYGYACLLLQKRALA